MCDGHLIRHDIQHIPFEFTGSRRLSGEMNGYTSRGATENGMRGYAAIGLHNPKNPLNVGEALRAAGCYGAAMLAASGKRYQGSRTDTQKAYKHMPLFQCEDLRLLVPYDCVPVAVDLIEGAQSLESYKHPERAFYVFGPEDGTLGADVLSWCRDVVYVPTKHCMNLAATVNVVLYDRAAKTRKTYNAK